MKVYSPNGKELSIRAKRFMNCPLCRKVAFLTSANRDEEGINLFCSNCNLEFISFPFRKFIKLKGFKE